jgi:hypothetical protein
MTSPAAGQFWVISRGVSGRGAPPFAIVQSAAKPQNEVAGPFTTQAQAQNWINSQNVPPPPDIGPPSFSIPNPFSWLGAVSHWVGDFVLSITDSHMWISIGWIVLGAFLAFWGIMLWLRAPQRAASIAVQTARAAA